MISENDLSEMRHLLLQSNVNPLFYHSVPMIYILDYTSGNYISISDSVERVMGLNREGFLKSGVEYTLEHYHRDHFKLYNERIFRDRIKFLQHVPPDEHKQYIFSYNHRFRDRRGQYQNLLQRNCFILSDTNRIPLASFGMVINIDHFHAENKVVHLVERITSDEFGIRADVAEKNVYFVNDEIPQLTNREKEILLLIADGLTTKQIAHRLYLSEYTVINHSRNMQEKFSLPNAASLVGYAVRHGLI